MLLELTRTTGEAAYLSVLQNDRAVSLEHELADQLIGVNNEAGRMLQNKMRQTGRIVRDIADRLSREVGATNRPNPARPGKSSGHPLN